MPSPDSPEISRFLTQKAERQAPRAARSARNIAAHAADRRRASAIPKASSPITVEEFKCLAIEAIGRTLGAPGVRHFCAMLAERQALRLACWKAAPSMPILEAVPWTLDKHMRFLGLREDDGCRGEVAAVCSALSYVWVEFSETEGTREAVPLMIVSKRAGQIHADGTETMDEMIWRPGWPSSLRKEP